MKTELFKTKHKKTEKSWKFFFQRNSKLADFLNVEPFVSVVQPPSSPQVTHFLLLVSPFFKAKTNSTFCVKKIVKTLRGKHFTEMRLLSVAISQKSVTYISIFFVSFHYAINLVHR
jgi:hypothetical protein